jgi:hypothetical protein
MILGNARSVQGWSNGQVSVPRGSRSAVGGRDYIRCERIGSFGASCALVRRGAGSMSLRSLSFSRSPEGCVKMTDHAVSNKASERLLKTFRAFDCEK